MFAFRWNEKVVVEDKTMHFHRCGAELVEQGRAANNQLDRLQPILKDVPRKLGYLRPARAMEPIPALSVVHYPGVDTARRSRGLPLVPEPPTAEPASFSPGPFEERSLAANVNAIPTRDYEHARYARENGYDFR